jgi:ABC-type bacteriocin/lantibiotic exporter with double-glycine peptidase domain
MEQTAVGSLANLVINSTPAMASAIVLALGAYLVIKGQWSLGSLFAFQAYLGYVYGPAQFLASTNLDLQDALASLERISAFYKVVPEENIGTGMVATQLRGEIEFRNVFFTYQGGEPLLEDISLHIAPGEHVAIVGPSGAGKTTLLGLILAFYQPSSGEIRFDGRPANEFELGSLRSRMGYVSQHTLLLSGSILENLRYGAPDATEEEVIGAAIIAKIHDFIDSLPAGYETEIGEQGVRLSEGQKQRISLARALLKDPDILVLDEPTSAVDIHTEKSIFLSLREFIVKKTTLVVSHRISIVMNADRILLLDQRGFVGVGTHRSLTETNEYYRSLVRRQESGSN